MPKRRAAPRGRMRMTYDPDADALAVELLPGGRSARTVRIGPGQAVDLDAQGRLVTLEVLNASAHYDTTLLGALGSPAEELTLTAAAAESGLDASTLRHQILNGKLRGHKRGRDWLVMGADLMTYLENRAPQGRPGAQARGERRTRSVKRTTRSKSRQA